ncbi:MAG: SRPBCC family protein [Methylobacter sp.]|nr:SRPBCC family protein [Methylobacter sp.]
MIETIVIIIAVLLAALLIYAATKPDIFRIWRVKSIKASPDRIFALINDFHNWDAWSPYEKIDPAMKRNISGTPRGKGSVYEWESNSSKAGIGRMEIIESSPPSKIAIQLDLSKPFESCSIVEFKLETKGDQTDVTWDMHGTNPYIGKIMEIFCDRDSMVGNDFEEGLVNLKTIAER